MILKMRNILFALDDFIGQETLSPRDFKEILSRVNADTEVDGEWLKYVGEQRENDLVAIIKDEKLKDKETHIFIENSFRDGIIIKFATCV